MSRVSHLRALFEEKVRQSNEEKERSKGQLSSPKGGNRRRDSFNSSSGSLFDRSNSNVNNSLTPSHSQENFPIEHATSTTDTNEKKQDMYFHVVQEPRSYPHIHREDSQKSLTNIEHVVTPDDTQAKELPKEENSTPVNDNLHIDVAHVQAHQVAEQQQAEDHHVNRQSPRDLPTVPEVHVVPEEPSQPSPRLEEPQNDASNVSSEATNEEQHQQHGEDGQPRSGIWKVEVLPSRSPRNLSTINEEGNASSTEPSPRANHSLSAQSTPRGDINDTAASPEVTPHVTEEPTSNVDAHQHVEIASDTHVKALGALSIVDDYIATPDAEHHVEDETPKQLLKVKHEDLEDMENLRQEEIDAVKLKLGALELKHITLGVLLIAHQGQWEVTNLNGILILAVDYVRKSYVLRLYKRDTCSAVWEHRFHKGFIYQQATPTFHTFETSEHNPLIYGLKLFDEQDAKDLHSKVLYFKNTVVKTKEELEAEKQQKSVAPLPAAQPQPAQQAPNTNADTSSKRKNKDKKNKRGFFDKIFGKSDSSSAPKDFQISGPSNFKHASHIGVDDKGEFQITNIPAEWKEIFRQAGIRKQDIKDMETFNFVVNVINDAVETQQAVAIQEERQQLHESNEAIVNNTNATTSPVVDQEPQASVVVEVKKPPPLPPRPAFMKEEHVDAQQPVETKPEVVVVERQVTPSEPTEVPSEHQSPNMASPAPPPPPPPPVITPEAKSPTVKKSILADLPPPPPARATLMSEIQQGTKLRKVDTSDQSLPDIKGLNQKQTKSLADTLAQAMAARRYEMQEAPSPVMTSNDDDWD